MVRSSTAQLFLKKERTLSSSSSKKKKKDDDERYDTTTRFIERELYCADGSIYKCGVRYEYYYLIIIKSKKIPKKLSFSKRRIEKKLGKCLGFRVQEDFFESLNIYMFSLSFSFSFSLSHSLSVPNK